MRLAIHNPFPPTQAWAEHEIARRIEIASGTLGWEARILHLSPEIDEFDPDAVLSLHPQAAPKLTHHPAVACLWNPPSLFGSDHWPKRHELSYDIHLYASDEALTYIRDILHPTTKPLVTAPMYPSSPRIAHAPSVRADSELFYIGSNWDGKRYPEVLRRLAEAGVLALHGSPARWGHLSGALRGSIPFDGLSVIETARHCGIGLCLHLPIHAESGIPNMRIFELCAAGALAVCDRNPFLLDNFADTVLYVDTRCAEEEIADQILAHVSWARAHPGLAKDMAAAAQKIFLERFTLETLLSPLPDLLDRFRRETDLRPGHPAASGADPVVTMVLPWDEAGEAGLEARLRMLAGQSGPRIAVAVPVPEGPERAGAQSVWRQLGHSFAGGGVVPVPAGGGALASTLLWAGLRAAETPWVGMLPGGVTLYPHHIESLLAAAEKDAAEVVYAGVLGPVPDGKRNPGCANPDEPLLLEWFDPFGVPDARQSTDRIHPGAVLARRDTLLPLLSKDPLLEEGAGRFLLRRLADRVCFLPTWQIGARSACGLDALPTVDGDRLARLEALVPRPDAGAATPEAPWRRAQRAGPVMNRTAEVAGVPTLAVPGDFAALPPERPILIYGASRGGRLVQLELMKWEALRPAGFLDSARDGSAHGLPIRCVTDVSRQELEETTIVIASQYVAEILATLKARGAVHIHNAYPYISVHAE